ncbi:hypothetical protein TNCV_2390261 [Trichonephila clavipes]|nr:hypothetical protein TNCV_2390261 [Trichonephila clavipes]
MSKFLSHWDLGYFPKTEKNYCQKIRAHYEQLSEFERGRTIGLKKVVPWPYFSEDKGRFNEANTAMNYVTACQTLLWPARLPDISSIEHV